MLRRKEREVVDVEDLKQIFNQSDVCRLAFAVNNIPYIVTLNFGYIWESELVLYFHSARQGRKIELIEQNNLVCFEVDTDHEIVTGEKPCDWTMHFKSAVGYGYISKVESPEERVKGMNLLMQHYNFEGEYQYDEKLFHRTEVLKLEVKEITGKMNS